MNDRILITRIVEAAVIGILAALGAWQSTSADLERLTAQVRQVATRADSCEQRISDMRQELENHDQDAKRGRAQ